MRNHIIAVSVAAALVSGCSSNQPESAKLSGTEIVYVPQRIAHEFYSSWGHDGRGGAALRKPTYQHVMGSEDMVMTTNGGYKDLRTAKALSTPMPAPTPAPLGVVVTPITGSLDKAISASLNAAPTWDGAERLANLKADSDEYMRAYRKFCQGAGMTLSEREWEIVALGGPKGIPAALRGKCLHSK